MADKIAKSVTGLPDGSVIVAYTDKSTLKKKATDASQEIGLAKQMGTYFAGGQTQNNSSGAAFGTTNSTGASTNVSNNPVVTSENLTAYYQQALSSKSDGYAKVRKAMLDAGIISKGTKSLSSISSAWGNVLQGAQAGGQDPFSYLSDIKSQGVGLDTTTAQKQNPYSQVTVWDPTKTKDYITQLSQTLLNREPTSEELTSLQNQLTAAQKNNPLNTVYKTDSKTGKVTATQTGGLDEQQFITDLLKKSPDYSKVKEAGTTAALQSVQDAAKANGIVLTPQDASNYAERVRNGEKLDEIAATFRKIAAISQPKAVADLLNTGTDLATIYQPYKAAMATTLELNPNDIQLTDPALANAVTGDKTMTTYEFQRALRKDNRWQYTNNARSEAADVATQVLKDFGFMG
jgi:hypothetical protein